MDRNNLFKNWQEGFINQQGAVQEMTQKMLQEGIYAEFLKFIGAKEYERTDQRVGHRNGTYPRKLQLSSGLYPLQMCRDREGNFQSELFARYQRTEKALLLAVIEMYFNGVSTRKVSNIMEELCGFNVSKSQVSVLAASLDDSLKAWRERPLLKKYLYLLFDARYEKVRENGQVISKAAVVSIGITDTGERDVIGCCVVNSESFEAWDSFIGSLRDRGLHGVEYVVSDENKGLRKALMKYFQGTKLQRCQVHFMRNFMGKLAKSMQPEGIKLLQEVFAADTKEKANELLLRLLTFLRGKKKDQVAEWLEENIEDALVVLELPTAHHKKMKSTNMLERLNQELKRRTKVIRIFPNVESCLRMLTAICQETSEDWGDKIYLKMNAE